MKKENSILSAIVTMLIFLSCEKKFDLPPVKEANNGAKITITDIKKKFVSGNIYRFKGDTILYCVVIADEVSGNLYKDIYVQDATGGLHVKLITSGGLFIGDSIRINLNDVVLNSYSDLIQLDSVDTGKSVVKLASGLNPRPLLVTIPQLIANTNANNKFQSQLIRLNNVEFTALHRNQPYANATTKAAIQYTLQDCHNNQVALRTSGYCYFAAENTPGGNGSLIAVASQYNNSIQLILRNSIEVQMTGPLCAAITPTAISTDSYLLKNFDDGSVSSGNWININAIGTINWSVKTSTNSTNPTKVAECNNYIGAGSQPACETWLISPAVDLSSSSSPSFSFTSASFYTGPPLQTFITTNYISGLPSTANWVALTPNYGTGSNHVSSGSIDLSAYKKPNIRVAFKYTGNSGSGQRWQVDNIRIGE